MRLKVHAWAVSVVTAVLLSACASPPPPVQSPPPAPPLAPAPVPYVEIGLASWYGPSHQGRRTASGERFDMNAMTAAHRTLPFDTIVIVTNLENRRSVRVRINDRGPYVKGRILDLSAAAARDLGIKTDGVAQIQLEPVP